MFMVEEVKGKKIMAGKILPNAAAGKILGVLFLVMIGGTFISTGFVPIGLAGIITVLLINSIVIIPTVWFGALTRFKSRVWVITEGVAEIRVLYEGINFVLPLIDDALFENLYSMELQTTPILAKALSKDKLDVDFEGSVQYKPDNLNTYIEMSPKTISDGMTDAVKSELGKICGIEEADTFVDFRSEIERLIRCALQLERLPHYYINKENEDWVMGDIFKEEIIEKNDSLKEKCVKLSSKNWILEPKTKDGVDVIRFYRNNASRIAVLFHIANVMNMKSAIETLYGISIKTFKLAKLSFSGETQKAFEEKRSAVAKMEAAQKRFEVKKEMLKEFLSMAISPADAVNLIETTTDVKGIERLIISAAAEGSQSVDIIAAAKLIAGKGGGGK